MLEAITGFFVITSIWAVWFWAAVTFCIVLAFAENEKNFWAFVSVGAFVALLTISPTVPSLFADPVALVMYLVAYYAIGGAWSFVKWFSFVRKRADEFGECKMAWIENRYNKSPGVEALEVSTKTKIPEDAMDSFLKYLSDNYFKYDSRYGDTDKLASVMPQARRFKEKIVTWILWWPTSAFWTLLNDPLVRIANWMYARFQGFYTKISTKVFAKYDLE